MVKITQNTDSTRPHFFSVALLKFGHSEKHTNLKKNPTKIWSFRKVASSRLSQLVAHFHVFHCLWRGIWWLCTVTFGHNGPKLNSRPVYCSQLYGTHFFSNLCASQNVQTLTAPVEFIELFRTTFIDNLKPARKSW